MKMYLRALVVLAVITISFPLLAADDAKKDAADKAEVKKDAPKKDDDKTKDEEAKKGPEKKTDKADKKPKFVYGSSFTGKIKEMNANSQRQFTVQITNKVAIPNQQAAASIAQQNMQMAQQQVQHQVRYAQIMQNRNPFQRQQQLAQLQQQMAQQQAQHAMRIAQQQAKMYTYKDVTQDVQLRAADDVRVRVPNPPADYDDKGNLKKYTAKELKELRGTENLPGYTAEFDALHTGQIVQIYLPKKTPSPTAKKGAGGKAGGKAKNDGGLPGIDLKNDDADLGATPHLEAVMIVIINDPTLQQPAR